MEKFAYYFRMILFTIYLFIMFLLIDNLYKPSFWSILYFILNIVYAFIIILTILSKKKCFKKTISYNVLNMGIYVYTFVIYQIILHQVV